MSSENKEVAGSLREFLGLPKERKYLDADPPRPPEEEEIRAYRCGELDAQKMEEVAWLIACYREWGEAKTRVIIEDAAVRWNEQSDDSHFSGADTSQEEPLEELRKGERSKRAKSLELEDELDRERGRTGRQNVGQLVPDDLLKEIARLWSNERFQELVASTERLNYLAKQRHRKASIATRVQQLHHEFHSGKEEAELQLSEFFREHFERYTAQLVSESNRHHVYKELFEDASIPKNAAEWPVHIIAARAMWQVLAKNAKQNLGPRPSVILSDIATEHGQAAMTTWAEEGMEPQTVLNIFGHLEWVAKKNERIGGICLLLACGLSKDEIAPLAEGDIEEDFKNASLVMKEFIHPRENLSNQTKDNRHG